MVLVEPKDTCEQHHRITSKTNVSWILEHKWLGGGEFSVTHSVHSEDQSFDFMIVPKLLG